MLHFTYNFALGPRPLEVKKIRAADYSHAQQIMHAREISGAFNIHFLLR